MSPTKRIVTYSVVYKSYRNEDDFSESVAGEGLTYPEARQLQQTLTKERGYECAIVQDEEWSLNEQVI